MSAMMAEACMAEGMVGLEPRVARIEVDMTCLRETVDRLDEKVDRLDEKVDRLDEKVDRLDEKVDRLERKVDDKFAKIDEKFGKVDEKFASLDKRMAAMEQGFENVKDNQARLDIDLRELRGSLDTKFLWILTTMIAFGTALIGAMAKGFHWLR